MLYEYLVYFAGFVGQTFIFFQRPEYQRCFGDKIAGAIRKPNQTGAGVVLAASSDCSVLYDHRRGLVSANKDHHGYSAAAATPRSMSGTAMVYTNELRDGQTDRGTGIPSSST